MTIILVFIAGALTGVVVDRNLVRGATSPPGANDRSSGGSTSTSTSTSSTTTLLPAALVVTSVSPSSGAQAVAPNAPITVSFSAPLSTESPVPTLSPP